MRGQWRYVTIDMIQEKLLRHAIIVVIVSLLGYMLILPLPLEQWTRAKISQEQPGRSITTLLVIGDSVSIQYRTHLRTWLDGCLILLEPSTLSRQSLIRLWRGPLTQPANAKSSGYLRDRLPDWLADERFDIVLVNVGLHDVLKPESPISPSSVETYYRENLEVVLTKLKRHANRVLFHSTTPLSPARPESEHQLVDRLNLIANEVSASLDVAYIDINQDGSLNSGQHLDPDGVHLSGEGARKVASVLMNNILSLEELSESRLCRDIPYK